MAALVMLETVGCLLTCSCAGCRAASIRAGRRAWRGGPLEPGL